MSNDDLIRRGDARDLLDRIAGGEEYMADRDRLLAEIPAARPLTALEPVAYMRNWAFRKEYGTKANRPRGWAFYTTSEGKLFDDDVPLWAVPPSSLPADVAGLVERLREEGGDGYNSITDMSSDELRAAAALEAQARQIADLTARAEKLGRDLNMARYGQPDFSWAVHKQAMADLEAENARLREALIWCSGSGDFQEGGKARKGWIKLCAPLIHMKGGDNG